MCGMRRTLSAIFSAILRRRPMILTSVVPSARAKASEPPAAGAVREPPARKASRSPCSMRPAVRRRARELGVELQFVTGSGPAGRNEHGDLDAFLAGGSRTAPAAGGSLA
ncbi:MAG: E3 binding domain-containing protein, partial [Brevundimonas sp.]|uniref:E3 binding domain-containing protein n=1 Tax=Brevundimonas sp. TaxID=1871086 RepID=UPI00391C8C0C